MNPFIAQITLFGGNFAPTGWALCQGQLLSIAHNTALFSLLGTTYGGDGQVTFSLPDLRGRVPIQQGQGPGLSNYVLGQMAGTESETLLITQLPSHTHMLWASNQKGQSESPVDNFPAVLTDTSGNGAPNLGYQATANSPMNPAAINPSGGNQPFSIMQPYLALNFIIALVGIFPSQS